MTGPQKSFLKNDLPDYKNHVIFNQISEGILVKINVESEMFQRFKSIKWFDVSNSQKKAIFKQFQELNEIEVTFYESGIYFETDNSVVRTSPFPILSVY